MRVSMKTSHRNIRFASIITALFLLQSCYTVTLVTKRGSGEGDPFNNEAGIFNNKKVVPIDTVIKVKLIDHQLGMFEQCPDGGFYGLEYRVTLGSVLLNAISFGTRRKVKVRYVCLKTVN